MPPRTRRNITKWDRCLLALKLEEHYKKKGKENIKYGLNKPFPNLGNPIIEQDILKSDPIDTSEDLAKIAGVSHGTLDKVKDILEKATSEQRAALDRDDTSIQRVCLSNLPFSNQLENG